MKPIAVILLLAMLLASCKYDCEIAAGHKGIWKLETYESFNVDTCISLPEGLKFGTNQPYQLNYRCEILYQGKVIANVVRLEKNYIYGNERIFIHFGDNSYGKYIAE